MERAYEHYRTTHVEAGWSPRHVFITLDQIRAQLPRDHADLIVELGCGSGELLNALRSMGYRRLAGVDRSREQVDDAARRGIEVSHGDARDFLRNLQHRPTLILAMDFLEHLDLNEIVEVLDESARRLSDGGTFIARMPNPQSPFGGALVFGDATHRTPLAPTAARQIFRIAGFDDITIAPTPPSVFGFRSYVRRILWRLQQRMFQASFSIEAGATSKAVFSMNYLAIARAPQRV